jgi:hypothetical protein
MAFEPENPLEKALVRASREPDARPEFYRLLMASDLYVGGRVEGAPSDEPVRPARGNQIHLAIVERDGRHLHPIFTTVSRARQFAPEAACFQALGRDLFTRTKGATFVLNPGSEIGKELVPDEIQYWLDQLVGRRIEINAKRTIRPARTHPRKLVKALGVLFVNRQVVTARMAELHRDGQEPRLLLAIEGDLDWRKLAREISAVVEAAAPDVQLDIVSVDPRNERDEHTKQLLSIAPFFERTSIPSN